MGSLSGRPTTDIDLDDIDLSDEKYRVSRSRPSEELYSSINRYGVLDPPVILNANGRNIIVFGHNRLRVCADCAVSGCGCVLVDAIRPEWYIEYALLKNYRGEISPYGKLRLAALLDGMPGLLHDKTAEILRTGFGVPVEYAAEPQVAARALAAAPAALRDYLDCRDIGFKILGRVLRLPSPVQSLLAEWLQAGPMRVNIFREAVELLLDISRRDGSTGAAPPGLPGASVEAGSVEDAVIRHLRGLRYPRYTGLMEKAEALMAEIARDRVSIEIPRNFEGDSVEVSMRFSKRDDADEISRRLGTVRADRIRALLDLL